MAEGGRVVAVLGYSARRGGGIHPICAARLAHAERLAEGADAVILSGWGRRRGHEAEAELMRAAWRGPAVPLVCDADARTTAENAANVAAAASELGARELVVVTSRWHRRRARALLAAATRGRMQVSVETPAGRPTVALRARELACFALLPIQLRRARR